MADFIQTSDLSERITFQEWQENQDEFGGYKKEYVDLFSCWACVREQLYKDVQTSAGTALEGSLTFIIRYQRDHKLFTNQRIFWNDSPYEILSINHGVYKKDFTTIIAKQVGK